MPDERPQSSMVQIVSMVLNCIQTIVIALLTVQANANHEKIEKVQETQQEVKVTQDAAAQTTKEVKVALDTRAAKIDKDAEEQKKATAANLYGTWKYLEGVATSPEEIKRAADAKRLYDEFTNGKK